MMNSAAPTSHIQIYDLAPPGRLLLDEVMAGLRERPRSIPCKYLYDARGSRLFDRICELDAYYPTRTERAIMFRYVDEMVQRLGPRCVLVEFGSGSSDKTRILLDHLVEPAGYVPIDISREHLIQSAIDLSSAYPDLDIFPVCADYTRPFDLPDAVSGERIVTYFPGSTIGNFSIPEARDFLRRLSDLSQPDGGVLIGVDLEKDPALLHAAYDDPEGVTAAFNKNLLARINRELGGEFDIDRFAHQAVYNEKIGRVEIYLVSLEDQVVPVGEFELHFGRGERIHTENSYKYGLGRFADLAASAGLQVDRAWTDPEQLFSVQYLVPAPSSSRL